MTSSSTKPIRSQVLRSITRIATANDICYRMDCYARILGTYGHDLHFLISEGIKSERHLARWIRKGQYRLWIFAEFAIEFGILDGIAVIGRVHGSAVPRGDAIYELEQASLPENERGSNLRRVEHTAV